MPKKIKTTILFAIFYLNLFAGKIAFAGPKAPMETFSIKNLQAEGQEQQKTYLAAYIVNLINLLALVIGSFALLAIIVGAIMLITSGGRENPQTRGKDIIIYALIGLVVAFGAYFITAFVQSLLYEIPS